MKPLTDAEAHRLHVQHIVNQLERYLFSDTSYRLLTYTERLTLHQQLAAYRAELTDERKAA